VDNYPSMDKLADALRRLDHRHRPVRVWRHPSGDWAYFACCRSWLPWGTP
jgi:hypothetical protein